MKPASLTRHARKRITERCGLSQDGLKRILDGNGGVAIHLQKGGRYVHRLIYSPKDEEWFMVVQDGGDGGVLTVMPLDFLEGRTEVTAAHKRQARHRAVEIMKPAKPAPPKPVAPPPPARKPKPDFVPPTPLPGWKILVRWIDAGKVNSKNLSRPPVEYGGPPDWTIPGPIHQWLKERLVQHGIPLTAIQQVWAEQRDGLAVVDQLLEHLPLTAEEMGCPK